VNNGFTHTPPHTHTDMATHTLAQWHSVCVFNGKHNARKEGKVPAQIACDENVQQPCPTTPPLPTSAPILPFLPPPPFYFLDFFAPLQPPLVSSKNCSLQMTNFTFSCLPSQKCECVCYLHLVFCSCSEFHFVTLSPPFKNCLYCLTRSHSKFSYTDCSSCSRKKE